MDMVNMLKRQQSHQDEKCQPKAIQWSLMNDGEPLIPQGRLQQVKVRFVVTHYLSSYFFLPIYHITMYNVLKQTACDK